MRKLRTCTAARFHSGGSKCPPDFDRIKGAILVEPGTKLPSDLTAEKLETLAHADRPSRIYGIVLFVEYAKNGGETQTSAEGYGPEEVTGVSARKDTFNLKKFDPSLLSALMKCKNKEWGAYFFDDAMLYGTNDGTDILAPYPMSSVYGDATPHPTSSAKAQMSVTFCHEDAEYSATAYDYIPLDFKPSRLTLGLTQVKLGKAVDGFKLYEAVGGTDITSTYGPLLASASSSVFLDAVTAVTYDSASDLLKVTPNTASILRLKQPSVLFENDIKGIEQAES